MTEHDETWLTDSQMVYVMLACCLLLGGIFGHAITDDHWTEKADQIEQQSYESGLQDGRQEGIRAVEDMWRNDTAVFAMDTLRQLRNDSMYRTIGVAFPEKNVSFVCDLNLEEAWQTDEYVFTYNKTDCGVEQTDIAADWDNANYSDNFIGTVVESSDEGDESSGNETESEQ